MQFTTVADSPRVPKGFTNARLYRAAALLTILFPPAAVAAGPVTYIKTYANLISNTTQQKDLTPGDVQATSDGGYVLLASTDCTTQACVSAQGGANPIVNWLIKTGASGNPQWQKELGCLSAPPGDYTIGLSVRQTTDGGYIVGGGALGCGTTANCGSLQCAIIEKLDSTGNLLWTKTYSIGAAGGSITSIEPTSDGGYIAAGGSNAPGPSPSGAVLIKLDASGNLQWQRNIGPAGSTTALFSAVQQTSDGGYAATGNYYLSGVQGALVVKFDASGNLQWLQAFNAAPSGSLLANAILQTSDGGYLAAGSWNIPHHRGGLLVKLDSSGNLVWQNAYTGHYCPPGGTCEEIGAVIYSAHQTADGGFFLAGDGDLVSLGGIQLVPWLGKVDSTGNLLWQHLYFQVASTGRPLSEYFAASALASDGGFIAAGWTEDYANGLGLLYVVKTDSSGLCGTCSEVHPAPPLNTVNPGLTISTPSLPVSNTATPPESSPSEIRSTTVNTNKDC